ncbi:MAG: hypothetical protein U1F77_11840 [Kiritimatiellia bacterium]
MFARILKVMLVAAWAVSLAWLIRFEAYPERFENTIAGYRGLFGEEMGVREQWMRIYLAGQPLGYTQTILDVDDKSADAAYELTTNASIQIPGLGGKAGRFRISGEVRFDGSYRVQSFGVAASDGNLRFLARGKRMDKDLFEVEYGLKDALTASTVRIPDDVIVQSPRFDMVMKRLRPGQHLWLKVLDPLTMKPSRMKIAAREYERITLFSGRKAEALRLEVTHQSDRFNAWVDRDGQMVRQETPFGLVLETCTAHEALSLDETPSNLDVQKFFKDGLLKVFQP